MASSSLESYGGDMFGSFYNFMLNEAAAGNAHARAKEIMKYQNDLNRENWSMNNAYNTPARQRERLAAAGLNPDLMYQSGAAGLQSATPAPAAAVASGAKGGAIDSSLGSRAASAAASLEMAEKTKNESIAQEVRNQFLKQQIGLELDNLGEDIKLKGKQREVMEQNILESQNNIDMLKKRVGNETYQVFLQAMTTAGQLDRWEHENGLNDEQKKWIGTGAMAAMIGAKGAAAQANAMANAINLFRDPKLLRETADKFIGEIKKCFSDLKEGLKGLAPDGSKAVDSICDWFVNQWNALADGELFTGEVLTDGHGNKVPVRTGRKEK